MKHKITFFAIVMMALAIPQSVKAYDFSYTYQGQTLYYNIVDGNAQVTYEQYPDEDNDYLSYLSLAGDLEIPSTVINGNTTYSVTSIGDWVFSECSGLTSVTIPNSVTSIGDGAFAGCRGLTSMTIPNSVTSIGDGAFVGCFYLTSVIFSGSITLIGESMFAYCGLTSVSIPNSVTSIGNYAFYGCSSMTSVSIPNSVTSIGYEAFGYCSGLTSVAIPDSVTSIGDYAFEWCNSLTSVSIGNSVTSIGTYAFLQCSGLASVRFGNSVISIGGQAFNGCSSLTSVTLPNSVTSIDALAFAFCSSLNEITSLATVAPTLGVGAFDGVTNTIPVNIPCGSTASYSSGWSYFSNFVEVVGFTYSVQSADEAQGVVFVTTEPTCSAPTAVFNAAAYSGYRFDHWSDGNTDNPRSLTLTSDTAIVAYFTQNASADTVYVYVHDTTVVTDTVTLTEYVTVHDTTVVTDTVTVDNYIYDTTVVTDTLRLTDTLYMDTLYIVDTVYITDTVYVGVDEVTVTNVKMYVQGSEIVVENADGYTVSLYDAVGRMLATKPGDAAPVRLPVATAGAYIVKVGSLPARKIVVVR